MVKQRFAQEPKRANAHTKGHPATWMALVAILVLAATLRFWNLRATEFKFDEARVANLAAHWVDTGNLPLRGMGSSTGIDNPPFAVYLMSVPALVSRDPLVATGFVALLNLAGVWGCYALGARYWGKGVGLLAALLLAASPWAVFYSRKVWAQDLLLPFVLLYVALLYAWWIDERPWASTGAIIVLAVLTQIHLAALALVPLFAIVLVVVALQHLRQRRTGEASAPEDKRGAFWTALGAGIALGLTTYAPYLIAEAREGWPNVKALLNASQAPAHIQWEAVRYALLNVGGREIHALAGAERYREFLGQIPDLAYWPDRVEEALVVIGALYLAYRCWRALRAPARAMNVRVPRAHTRHNVARYGLLLLWLVTPVIFFLRSSTPVYPHYLIPLYPAPYLAVAILAVESAGALRARALGKRAAWKKPIYALGAFTLASLIAWQSTLSLSIHAFVSGHDTPGGMGTPVRILRQVVGRMERYAEAWDNPEVVMLCPGDQPRWDECPAVFGYMTARSLEVRFVDGRATLLFPQSEADTLVVLAPEEMTATNEIGHYAQWLGGEDIPLRENVGAFRFYRLPGGESPTPAAGPEEAPARLANGVELLCYTLSDPPAAGQTTRLALHWRIAFPPGDPPAQGYSFANHLLTTEGQRVAQKDGPGYRVELWRAGDALVSWFDLALDAAAPPPPYRLRTGMYVYTPPDRFATVPVFDGEGQPLGEAIEWAPTDQVHIKTGSCIMSKSVVQ